MTSSQPTQPLTGPQPTPSLAEYLRREAEDDNTFWRLESGDHQNLLEEAIEEIERLRGHLDRFRTLEDRIPDDSNGEHMLGWDKGWNAARSDVRKLAALALELDQDGSEGNG